MDFFSISELLSFRINTKGNRDLTLFRGKFDGFFCFVGFHEDDDKKFGIVVRLTLFLSKDKNDFENWFYGHSNKFNGLTYNHENGTISHLVWAKKIILSYMEHLLSVNKSLIIAGENQRKFNFYRKIFEKYGFILKNCSDYKQNFLYFKKK